MALGDYVKDVVSGAVKGIARNVDESVGRALNRRFKEVQNRFMWNVMSLFIISISIIFIALSIVLFFIDYLYFDRTISFLVVGIIMLFAGIIFKIAS